MDFVSDSAKALRQIVLKFAKTIVKEFVFCLIFVFAKSSLHYEINIRTFNYTISFVLCQEIGGSYVEKH